MSAADMARLGDVRPQTVLKLLGHLCKHKLIESRRDPAHGRIRRLHLTFRGLDIARKCEAISNEISTRLTDSIPKPLLQRFRRHLLDAIALLQTDLGRKSRTYRRIS